MTPPPRRVAVISAIVLIFILVMISFPIFTYTYFICVWPSFFIEDLNKKYIFYLIYYGYDYILNEKGKQEKIDYLASGIVKTS